MEMEIRCKVISKFARIPLLAQFSGNLSSSNAVAGGTNNLPPLLFHPVHGENIRVSECGAVARRVESFCKGLTFSSRPVRIAEKVYVKIIGVSNNWSGVIRFGFTANDPSTLRNALPKYACPDMTNKPGCWAKALAERFAEVDSVLFYYVTQTGDVHFGINGEERGVFFTGVETRGPLWAVLDVYGNSTAIQLLDPRQQLNNSRRIQAPCSTSSGVSACQQGPSPSSSTSSSSSSSSSNIGMVDTVSDVDRIIPSIASLSLQQQQHLQVHLQQQQNLQRASQMAEGFSPSSAVTPTASAGDAVEQVPVQLSRFQPSGSHYSPLPFHRTRGRNVRLSNDRCVASRLDTEFSRGYVFTSRPIVLGEKIVVQVLATDAVYVGALAFGLTSCNPSQIPSGGADLPDDSDLLLDRPEYWVVSKDVAGARPERGDEISVCVTHLGEVLISKNGSPPEVRMHVDHTLELWAFFDVYGTTQKIRIVGSFIESQPPTTSPSPVPQIPATSGMSSCIASSSPATSYPNSRPSEQQMQAPNLSRLRVCLPSSSDHPTPPPYHPAPSVVLTPVASVSGTTSPSPAHPNHHPHHHSSHHHHSSSHQSSPASSSASPTPGSGVLVVNLPPAQSNYLNQQQQSSQQPHGHGSQQSHQGSQQSGHHQNHRMPHMSSSSSLSVVAIPPSGSGTLLSTYSHTYIEPVSATTSYSTMESSGGRTGTMMSGAGGSGGAGSECSICYERSIDSVLYMCGHMCMCYECALQQWRGKGGGHCPLCRAVIKDVIRTYKS
ncbi:protein neuralized isoform X2 [Ischnura elegans]|uniref:protein neuralized isoform X2 n=1 Tax=Ischnura elegans TaxID=197161 RepID=UPI001ED88AF6|nr:protein neuralized isoform X2 [Ischnura elegans]